LKINIKNYHRLQVLILKKIIYIKKLLFAMVTKGVSSLIKVGSVALLIKMLGIEDYGVYIIGMSMFLLAQTISRIGIDLYIQQQSARYKSDVFKVNSLIGLLFFSSVVSLILMAAFTFLIEFYANGVASDIWIYFICAAPFYSICWNLTYLLRGLEKVSESIILMELSLPILQLLVFGIGYYYWSWTVTGAVVSLFIASAISVLIFVPHFLYKNKFSIKIDLDYFFYSIKHSKSFLAVAVTSMLLVWSDTYFIGYYMLPQDVALYSIIMKLGMIILLPVAVITVYTNNFMSEWHKREGLISELKSQVIMNVGIIVAITFTLVIFLLLVSPYIFEYFEVDFTNDLKGALVAYLIAQCFFAMSGPIDSIFLMGTRQHIISKINIVMVVVNIILCALLIPKYGLIGASISTLISVIIAKGTQLLILNNIYGYKYNKVSQ
jgi:O-antigen/teichoic acid export membrane protein